MSVEFQAELAEQLKLIHKWERAGVEGRRRPTRDAKQRTLAATAGWTARRKDPLVVLESPQ